MVISRFPSLCEHLIRDDFGVLLGLGLEGDVLRIYDGVALSAIVVTARRKVAWKPHAMGEALINYIKHYNTAAAPFVWKKRSVSGSQIRDTISNLSG
ncbi:MAG: hypothetical protein FWC27_09085 [Firmicutes bacterium]|nr:hypothetical protein [Bacillota bacterium]